ncbi:MAG TPA: tetrahydrofolate dehydrogenase/cyclohydrolase catalytic domain-containing protein [Clostridia bacterium]|nr:MAG: Bifunctional protein FolD protein [Firmicutes bacterium ADurb.Bin248]HOG00712.1 tetrahydrofolate dehydrogenase/cyclohydrolase catalytic domain-containing protein [Clostridia bacterium]HOS17675.1 tetrahydrofolate dehydrogenase/cyclohydrolase catalytic domain-containing protein [Clostridia bacterium]HPK16420.1 tetrahydrofolate dehydrogenase/cyclohydrolase catalytic domain-containing protein [Clostridia bacterium]
MELAGLPAAQALAERVRPEIESLGSRGVTPRLAVVRAGARPDDLSYEKAIAKRFAAAGCEIRHAVLPEDCGQSALVREIALLDGDKTVHGILVLRPLPPQIDAARVASLVSPEKDVDGMNPASLGRILLGERDAFAPCTAEAVVALLDHYEIPLAGKRVTIVGRSAVVGRPLMALLLARDATVSVCHTKTADLACACHEADILVACAGRPGLVTAEHVGACCTVVDVGVNMVEGRLTGDVAAAARAKALNFSPVPGGVGALTGAVLLAHTVRAAGKAV